MFVRWWYWTFNVFRKYWWLAVLVKVLEIMVIIIAVGGVGLYVI